MKNFRLYSLLLGNFLLYMPHTAMAVTFEGYYLGLGGGYSKQHMKDRYFQQNEIPVYAFSAENTYHRSTGLGQLFAGYSVPFSDYFYGGLEGGITFYGSTKQYTPVYPLATDYPTQASISQQYGFTVSLLPGLFVTPSTLTYGRIGYEVDRYKAQLNTAIPGVYPSSANQLDWTSAVLFGIGINQYVSTNWSLRLEYNYLSSGPIAGVHGTTFSMPYNARSLPIVDQHFNTYHLNTNGLTLGVLYNFNM